ncbi:MAG: DUF4160 domain-containing protein [Deltaproteobacteria bacterium]|nr:DUF4160 domain-containing protein [Deltaproteobacteria bacterium]
MGEVECFALEGLEIWFNSDDHLPPHFHLATTSWEIRVRFLREADDMIQPCWGRAGPTGAQRRRITKAAEEHRAELLQEWEAKVVTRTPGSEK